MIIPTEPIGSIPRPPDLIAAANQNTAAAGGTAFARIGAPVEGTALAHALLKEAA